jgi:hypothetical protein
MLFEAATRRRRALCRGFNRIKVERGENTGEASLTSLNEFGVNHESCRTRMIQPTPPISLALAHFNRNIRAQTDGNRIESRLFEGRKGCVRTTVTCLKTIYFGIQLRFFTLFGSFRIASHLSPCRQSRGSQNAIFEKTGKKNLFLSVNWFYNKFHSSHIYWSCCLPSHRMQPEEDDGPTKGDENPRALERKKWTFTTLWIEI